jgi:hypothetical protein
MSSAQLVDVVMGIALLEAVALLAYFRVTGRGVAPLQFLPNLFSGLALMVGLRCVITGQPTRYLAVCLVVSGLLHCVGLWRSWRH